MAVHDRAAAHGQRAEREDIADCCFADLRAADNRHISARIGRRQRAQNLGEVRKLGPIERSRYRIIKDDVPLGQIEIVDRSRRSQRRGNRLVRQALRVGERGHAASSSSTVAGSALAMPLSVLVARSRMLRNVVRRICSASRAGRLDLRGNRRREFAEGAFEHADHAAGDRAHLLADVVGQDVAAGLGFSDRPGVLVGKLELLQPGALNGVLDGAVVVAGADTSATVGAEVLRHVQVPPQLFHGHGDPNAGPMAAADDSLAGDLAVGEILRHARLTDAGNDGESALWSQCLQPSRSPK